MSTPDDLLVCGEKSLVQWTGLWQTNVAKLCSYVCRCNALDCFCRQENNDDHTSGEPEDEAAEWVHGKHLNFTKSYFMIFTNPSLT